MATVLVGCAAPASRTAAPSAVAPPVRAQPAFPWAGIYEEAEDGRLGVSLFRDAKGGDWLLHREERWYLSRVQLACQGADQSLSCIVTLADPPRRPQSPTPPSEQLSVIQIKLERRSDGRRLFTQSRGEASRSWQQLDSGPWPALAESVQRPFQFRRINQRHAVDGRLWRTLLQALRSPAPGAQLAKLRRPMSLDEALSELQSLVDDLSSEKSAEDAERGPPLSAADSVRLQALKARLQAYAAAKTPDQLWPASEDAWVIAKLQAAAFTQDRLVLGRGLFFSMLTYRHGKSNCQHGILLPRKENSSPEDAARARAGASVALLSYEALSGEAPDCSSSEGQPLGTVRLSSGFGGTLYLDQARAPIGLMVVGYMYAELFLREDQPDLERSIGMLQATAREVEHQAE